VTALAASDRQDLTVLIARFIAWAGIAATFVFLINNYLNFWQDWPGISGFFQTGALLGGLQLVFYAAAIAGVLAFVLKTADAPLRPDSDRIYAITAYLIRAAFWGVFLIGVADAIISFLRVEDLLGAVVGAQLETELGRSSFRGTYVHYPLFALGFVIAAINRRGLGFHWLALLVVVAELLIVFSRFVLSYEQAFMADLVRFWYAALFLFASAYTLIEEGHVRVDVFYASFTNRTKGFVNATGSIVLGVTVCVVILVFGMGSKNAVINGPMQVFEVTQAGFGLYVKYWMAGFLGIFAVTMLIQFLGFFIEGLADYRDEPGKRTITPSGGH